jgi:O-antigen/teichoic acid export membrane protein
MRFQLLKDLVALCFGQLLATLVTLLAFAFLARTLDTEHYGFVEFVVALSLFFTMLVDLGLGSIGARELAREPASASHHAATVPALRLLIAVAAIPVMGLSGLLIHGSSRAQPLVWLFALALLGIPWRLDWLFQGLDRMWAVATSQVLRAVVFAVGVFLLVRGPDDVVRVGLVEVLAAGAAALFYVVLQAASVAPLRLRFSQPALAGLLRQASSIGLSNVVWALHQYVHLFLLATLVGGEQAAWFGAAHRIVAAILLFSYVYHFNLFPTVVRGAADSPERFDELMRASFRIVGWAGVFVALALSLFARPVLETVFGERFGTAAPALAVLVWAFPVTALGGHARWSLIANGEQRCVLRAQTAGALVALPISPFLILEYGAVGGAIAMVAATLAVWLIAHVHAVRRVGRIPLLPPLGWPLFLALLAAVPLAVLGPSPWLPWLKAALLAAAAVLAPWGDPALLPDLRRLAHAKSDRLGHESL